MWASPQHGAPSNAHAILHHHTGAQTHIGADAAVLTDNGYLGPEDSGENLRATCPPGWKGQIMGWARASPPARCPQCQGLSTAAQDASVAVTVGRGTCR